jgi:hypothetical protein
VAIDGKIVPLSGPHYLAMSVAASMTYHQLNGARVNSPEFYTRALNESALALAQMLDVYYVNEHGQCVKIPTDDLRQGVFERGATELVVGTRVYARLCILRDDFSEAVMSLQQAQSPLAAAKPSGNGGRPSAANEPRDP